jgi:hypothetical protein
MGDRSKSWIGSINPEAVAARPAAAVVAAVIPATCHQHRASVGAVVKARTARCARVVAHDTAIIASLAFVTMPGGREPDDVDDTGEKAP